MQQPGKSISKQDDLSNKWTPNNNKVLVQITPTYETYPTKILIKILIIPFIQRPILIVQYLTTLKSSIGTLTNYPQVSGIIWDTI